MKSEFTPPIGKISNINGQCISLIGNDIGVRAYRNLEIEQLIDSFDVKTPDGFPVAKSLKILMKNDQKRVDGYNLFHKTINYGLEKNVSHYFFGNNEHVVQTMINKLNNLYPGINIAGFYCPPLTETEKLTDNEYIKDLLKRDPDIVWVSLGFPKQENFIYNIKKIHQVRSNFVGVGAVFEWVAGTKVKAPEWLADFGLEWIFRLVQEPKRLFRRYLIDNFLFIIYFIKQYLGK